MRFRHIPWQSMPRDITADVMARIQTIPAPRPFRLTWNDLVLGIVLSMCIGAVWFSLYHLPPLVVAQLRKESILFYQHILVNARWLIPVVSFGLAAVPGCADNSISEKELMKKRAHFIG